MKKTKNYLQEKFEKRTIKPADSSWQRLSDKLDEHPYNKKKPWLLYVSVAASLALFIAVGGYFFSYENKKQFKQPIKELIVLENTEKIIKQSLPIQESEVVGFTEEKVEIIASDTKKEGSKSKQDFKRNIKTLTIAETVNVTEKHINSKLEKNDKSMSEAPLKLKDSNLHKNIKSTSRIQVSSAALLAAVSEPENKIKALYTKHNTSREQLENTIKKELEKTNLKVNPKVILAEVERSIDDDFFKNNFLKTLKRRVNDIATAIVSRND
ncbi:hypothetical protein [Polaribacter tangerinus]|uniref:hypothetical protein n=1 Tax=Polaribacter tangerinus TaxID=1920034 RepID=UPI000B4BD0B3|nr:hypothetical protein [Polaribacter tangerinus]